ncbi:TPA: hypothetical protein PTV74_003187 [Clostridium botulinum]|nr:hypothetical protein [Clostridium botulinum]HDK7206342.1 hypothetical protein [Clostridium botulinum]HDK7210078.1 hypothetical protein [Clostridium botulinum]HDK7265527.1 hypothetical protein [Clostridium botulinum]HDK7269375.1 hypothetical protein [Clostridium botulinum]
MTNIYYIHKLTGIKVNHEDLSDSINQNKDTITIALNPNQNYPNSYIYRERYNIKDLPFSEDWEIHSYDNEFTINELYECLFPFTTGEDNELKRNMRQKILSIIKERKLDCVK